MKSIKMQMAFAFICDAFIISQLLAFCGCAMRYTTYYDIMLEAVERPKEARERYGAQKIAEIEEEGVQKYCFEDEMVKIVWLPKASSTLSFVLENKTAHSLKILWDEVAFVDNVQTSHRVMHSGVKYADRNASQPPSVVARGASVTDIILPSDNVYMDSVAIAWREMALLPVSGSFDEQQQKAKGYIGQIIEVVLPLEIQGVVNEYIFTFKVEDAEVISTTPY